ncbi:hypothetical protein IEQ34_021225 [Dendrobium chrysotoxum]|uniref:Uncharacterized protein n=1 Tax=Dendrobium chrysotoxum TaxID=161865 RepID=A0AAV7G4E8_DENCH|nr:hypothetical protein IEQ34_021225 [Dendrobium chrysotoxum]
MPTTVGNRSRIQSYRCQWATEVGFCDAGADGLPMWDSDMRYHTGLVVDANAGKEFKSHGLWPVRAGSSGQSGSAAVERAGRVGRALAGVHQWAGRVALGGLQRAGDLAELRALGGSLADCRASGGGPAKSRASGGGLAKTRTSGGGPAKSRASGRGLSRCRASGRGPAKSRASGGGMAKFRVLGGGPVKSRASSGGPAKSRASGGGPAKSRASGGGPAKSSASGGGPAKCRVSGGGLVKSRASGGGPTKSRASGSGPLSARKRPPPLRPPDRLPFSYTRGIPLPSDRWHLLSYGRAPPYTEAISGDHLPSSDPAIRRNSAALPDGEWRSNKGAKVDDVTSTITGDLLMILHKNFHIPDDVVTTVPKRSDRAGLPPLGYLIVSETSL